MKKIFCFLIFSFNIFYLCAQDFKINYREITKDDILVGAERTDQYFPLLKGKNIAIVANQTSMIKNTHLVDSLLHAGFSIKKIFSPEHGFRGNAEAGKKIDDYTDKKTGLPVVSLYGKKKKPNSTDLKGIDIIIFDIQDVGVRFFTYISTMHYMMEACAENNITFLVLDRPNPNGFYIDGPVLDTTLKSFVGIHPVPIVHGMTLAEYACMINGEEWLKNGIHCKLKYVTVSNYNHTYFYKISVNPSPNLKNMNAIYLYPSLCLFEGTIVSVGRGTDKPFQVIGHPLVKDGNYSFTPVSIPSECEEPPYKNVLCKGYEISTFGEVFIKNSRQLYLYWLIGMYQQYPDKEKFFSLFFDKLAGTTALREQIIKGESEENIRKSWQPGINKFKKIRKKYLLYPDFE